MIYNPNAQESERKGRNIFQTLADQIGWQIDYTDAEFCDIDLHIKCTSKDGRNIQAAGEIKNRDASAIKYSTHIIEVHKIKALLADNKDIAMFINIFGDDIFILKSATYRVQWDFACKATKFILLYIFLAQQKCRRHKIPLPHKAT